MQSERYALSTKCLALSVGFLCLSIVCAADVRNVLWSGSSESDRSVSSDPGVRWLTYCSSCYAGGEQFVDIASKLFLRWVLGLTPGGLPSDMEWWYCQPPDSHYSELPSIPSYVDPLPMQSLSFILKREENKRAAYLEWLAHVQDRMFAKMRVAKKEFQPLAEKRLLYRYEQMRDWIESSNVTVRSLNVCPNRVDANADAAAVLLSSLDHIENEWKQWKGTNADADSSEVSGISRVVAVEGPPREYISWHRDMQEEREEAQDAYDSAAAGIDERNSAVWQSPQILGGQSLVVVANEDPAAMMLTMHTTFRHEPSSKCASIHKSTKKQAPANGNDENGDSDAGGSSDGDGSSASTGSATGGEDGDEPAAPKTFDKWSCGVDARHVGWSVDFGSEYFVNSETVKSETSFDDVDVETVDSEDINTEIPSWTEFLEYYQSRTGKNGDTVPRDSRFESLLPSELTDDEKHQMLEERVEFLLDHLDFSAELSIVMPIDLAASEESGISLTDALYSLRMWNQDAARPCDLLIDLGVSDLYASKTHLVFLILVSGTELDEHPSFQEAVSEILHSVDERIFQECFSEVSVYPLLVPKELEESDVASDNEWVEDTPRLNFMWFSLFDVPDSEKSHLADYSQDAWDGASLSAFRDQWDFLHRRWEWRSSQSEIDLDAVSTLHSVRNTGLSYRVWKTAEVDVRTALVDVLHTTYALWFEPGTIPVRKGWAHYAFEYALLYLSGMQESVPDEHDARGTRQFHRDSDTIVWMAGSQERNINNLQYNYNSLQAFLESQDPQWYRRPATVFEKSTPFTHISGRCAFFRLGHPEFDNLVDEVRPSAHRLPFDQALYRWRTDVRHWHAFHRTAHRFQYMDFAQHFGVNNPLFYEYVIRSKQKSDSNAIEALSAQLPPNLDAISARSEHTCLVHYKGWKHTDPLYAFVGTDPGRVASDPCVDSGLLDPRDVKSVVYTNEPIDPMKLERRREKSALECLWLRMEAEIRDALKAWESHEDEVATAIADKRKEVLANIQATFTTLKVFLSEISMQNDLFDLLYKHVGTFPWQRFWKLDEEMSSLEDALIRLRNAHAVPVKLLRLFMIRDEVASLALRYGIPIEQADGSGPSFHEDL